MKSPILFAILLVAVIAGFLVQQNYFANKTSAPTLQTDYVDGIADGRIDFALPDLDGNMRQLSEWDGEARLVNFWATWCAPCRREIPLLKALQDRKAENQLQVIGVAVDMIDDVAQYAEEAQFNYPILVGQEDAMAAAESSGIDFIGLPFTVVVTPDGKIVNTHMGEITQDHLDRIVRVMRDFDSGEFDLASAREQLQAL